MGDLASFKGFISGLHAGNFDISHIFIDSFYKLVENGTMETVEEFVLWCDKFGSANSIDFTILVSEDPALASETLQKYM